MVVSLLQALYIIKILIKEEDVATTEVLVDFAACVCLDRQYCFSKERRLIYYRP